MFRIIRYALIIGPLSLVFVLLASPVEASECSLFLWEEAVVCNSEFETESENFFTPEAFDESLFGSRVYARLADNANVYPGPD